jgi:hypothetical protein
MNTNELLTTIRQALSLLDESDSAKALAALDQLEAQQAKAEPVAWMASDGRHVVSRPNYDDMSFISRGGYPTPLYTHSQQGGGLSVDEVMGIYFDWDAQAMDGIIPMIPDLRARLTAKAQGQ